MKARVGASVLALGLVATAVVVRSTSTPTPLTSSSPTSSTEARVQRSLSKLPLYFIENRGQMDSRVDYYVQGSATSLYFTSDGVTFSLARSTDEEASAPSLREGPPKPYEHEQPQCR